MKIRKEKSKLKKLQNQAHQHPVNQLPIKGWIGQRRLDVDRRKKMYKNKRKPVHEKNLRQNPAIIPLESTICQKDPRLDLNIHWIYLNSTTFTEEIEGKLQPVSHIIEDSNKEDKMKLLVFRDAEEALQIIEEIISEDKPENVHITEVITRKPEIWIEHPGLRRHYSGRNGVENNQH